MKAKKGAVYLRRIIFLVLLSAILLVTAAVFERKTVGGEWNYTLKVGGFSNLPANSVNVVGVGSSHMYCTLNPVHIYEQTGDSYYVLATQQQPVEATYYYVKEALEKQSPEVVIIEGFMYLGDSNPVSEGVAHDAVDPFPNNLNKWKMIAELNTEDAKENYYFSFLKYHTRWKELSRQDFDFRYKSQIDPFCGFVFLTDAAESACAQVSYEDVQQKELNERNAAYLKRTIELIRAHGSEPMVLLSPYSTVMDDAQRIKALHAFCEAQGVPILDLNVQYDQLMIDNDKDFYDGGHFNVFGAEKASKYIADFINERFTLSKKSENSAFWQESLVKYLEKRNGKV